eukprot:TRINITY_DN18704_c0_g1::TRINITY_DN18704_c0_g1_i1::g.20462::m.20462 TRINITY_DN18704_c0_g1::TRINITY_DN18704_c0_g1_i1::g.20462  ORF type:complete len:400 (+),score=98.46,sp/Q68F68/TOR2A_XENLA/25.15/1e-10,Torsin/PF06309.6/3.4e-07,AAA_5/PF07728.9/0.012,AAA/PF00004.24/3.5e+03,AAA/PF00004.24/0.26,AAA_2/PF07724.9/0.21 TRINITY_DN18704_c0_g1_i1:84-1283(+)
MKFFYILLTLLLLSLSGVPFTLAFLRSGCRFDKTKIASLDTQLEEKIKCQSLVTTQLAASLDPNFKRSDRPLVLSFHGATATGKTWTHQLLARLLLPGQHETLDGVAGYQTLHCSTSLDEDRAIMEFFDSVMRHASDCKGWMSNEAIVVIEELEECSPRMIQRLLGLFDSPGGFEYGGKRLNLNGYVFILTSNIGAQALNSNVLRYGRNISLDRAMDILRVEMDKHVQDLRVTARIDYYLPFLPFRRPEVKELIASYIAQLEPTRTMLPSERLLDFLADKFEYEQGFSRVGGNVRGVVVTYISKPVASALKQVAAHLEPLAVTLCMKGEGKGEGKGKGKDEALAMDITVCSRRPPVVLHMMHAWDQLTYMVQGGGVDGGGDLSANCLPLSTARLTYNCV